MALCFQLPFFSGKNLFLTMVQSFTSSALAKKESATYVHALELPEVLDYVLKGNVSQKTFFFAQIIILTSGALTSYLPFNDGFVFGDVKIIPVCP